MCLIGARHQRRSTVTRHVVFAAIGFTTLVLVSSAARSDAPPSAASSHGGAGPVTAWPSSAAVPPPTGLAPVAPPRARPSLPPGDRAIAQASALPPQASTPRVFEPAETVARVGDQVVVRGDIMGDVNLIMAAITEKIPEDELEKAERQLEQRRSELFRELLEQAVDRKLMYIDFLRSIPPDKQEEVQQNIDRRIGEAMQQELDEMREELAKTDDPKKYAELARKDSQIFRLALIMKDHELLSLSELDQYLRRHGSSLKQQQEFYAERKLGQQQMFEQIEFRPEVTYDEMLDYYREHAEEFHVPTRVRWEQLTARFDHFPDKVDCGTAIAEMGNQVLLGGAPLWAVAKRSSQEANAKDGGYHDWIEKGDLTVSREIREALFSLPENQLSHIIEDAEGLHIVRVLERQDAHMIPFTEAQVEIRKKIQARKRLESINQYVERLRESIPVWTIYDDASSSETRTADRTPPSRSR